MSEQLMNIAEQPYLKRSIPEFSVGNTVDVTCRIIEGGRERLQIFNGVVIARKGHGVSETFTVRRIVNDEGVERVFMLHSPLVADIKVRRRGKIRRAKLYYLRGRVGKSRRLREVRLSAGKRAKKAGDEAAGAATVGATQATPVGA